MGQHYSREGWTHEWKLKTFNSRYDGLVFWIECSCGWDGPDRESRVEAMKDGRNHSDKFQ